MPKPIRISASRSASILDLNGYNSKLHTWLEMMEAREPGFCAKHKYNLPEFNEDSPALRWGKAFESAVIELAEHEHGHKIINREDVRKYGDYITCHIDGEYDYKTTGHEGKSTSYFYFKDNFGEPGTDRVPLPYQTQCQHQFICNPKWEQNILSVLVFPRRVEEWEEMGYVAGHEECIGDMQIAFFKDNNFVSRFEPMRWAGSLSEMGYFHQYIITPHEELQKKMLDRYREFWEVNILDGVMPEPRDYDDLKMIYTEPVGTIVATPEVESLLTEYRNIQSEIGKGGELSKRLDQIKTDTLKFMAAADHTVDTESRDKWLLLSPDGKKLAQYGKQKNGTLVFR